MYRHDSDEFRTARARLVSYSARLLDDGLAVGSAGNMSVRAGDVVAITPSGIGYADMRPADICLVSLDGTQLDGPDAETPSSETPMHLAIYAATRAAAVAALDGRSAVILRNHGAVSYGRDLVQAYDRALLLEWLARTYRLALSYGEPAILSAAELDEVTAETRRRRYGERRSSRRHDSRPHDTRPHDSRPHDGRS